MMKNNKENEFEFDDEDFKLLKQRRKQLQEKYGDEITLNSVYNPNRFLGGYTEYNLYANYNIQFTVSECGCALNNPKILNQLLDLYESYKEKHTDCRSCINTEIFHRIQELKNKAEKQFLNKKSWLDRLFNL